MTTNLRPGSVTASVLILGLASGATATTSQPAAAPVNDSAAKFYSDSQCQTELSPRDGEHPIVTGTMSVWVFDDTVANVKFDEKKRDTRFFEDLRSILKTVLPLPAPAVRTCKEYRYTLQNKRASVTVTAYDRADKAIGSMVVVAGPREHLFLGLDLPVNNHKTLKYDSASGSLLPQSNTPELYLSFNFLDGDILAKAQDLHWYQDFSGKLLIRASSRPLDSIGVGIGYRFGKLSVLGYSLDALSVFAARMWTKQDAISNGQPSVNGSTDAAWRFGVTYDVGTVAKYVHW
jgi:hypothetical protein